MSRKCICQNLSKGGFKTVILVESNQTVQIEKDNPKPILILTKQITNENKSTFKLQRGSGFRSFDRFRYINFQLFGRYQNLIT